MGGGDFAGGAGVADYLASSDIGVFFYGNFVHV